MKMKDKSQFFRKVVYAALSFIVIGSTIFTYVPPTVKAEETKIFTDIKATDYFYEAVNDLASREIVAGYSDQTFRPFQPVTRAQAAKVLSLALGLDVEKVENPGFQDVKPADGYYHYVAALAKAGIISGFGDNTFRPQETLSRAQMAKILSIGFALGEDNLTNNPFTDVPKDAWYTKYLSKLLLNQITYGTTSNTFSPNERVTRGQLAEFIIRSERAVEPSLIGWVSAGEPVSDAMISLLNSNGEKIFEDEELMTTEYGDIRLESVDSLPSDFKVVVQGGSVAGTEFSGKLMADVRDYHPGTDTIYVNVVTTMVSVYLDQHPAATMQEAEEAIKKFLEIPLLENLPTGMHLTGEYFSYELFLSEATNNGGINAYINQLIGELDSGKTHSFHQELPQGVASFIAINLAKGALSYTGGELAGWGLSTLGVDFGKKEDQTEEERKKIQEGLEGMKNQLNQMSIQLDDVNEKLGNIMSELNKISHKIDMSSYNGRISDMSTLISDVEGISKSLVNNVKNPPTNVASYKNRMIRNIELNILDKDLMVHNQLTGKIAGQQPLLQLWKEIVYNERFLTQQDYDLIESQFEYFEQLQEHMLLLQVEYYHATEETEGDNSELIMECIERFEAQIAEQRAMLPKPIPKNTIVDTTANLMYYSKNIAIEFPSSVSIDKKSHDTMSGEMSQLAASNPAELNDWKPFSTSDVEKFTKGKKENFPLSPVEFINNGWPGVKGGTIVVVAVNDMPGYMPGRLFYFVNNGKIESFSKLYPPEGINAKDATVFPLIMVSRSITDKDYGYKHLQK